MPPLIDDDGGVDQDELRSTAPGAPGQLGKHIIGPPGVLCEHHQGHHLALLIYGPMENYRSNGPTPGSRNHIHTVSLATMCLFWLPLLLYVVIAGKKNDEKPTMQPQISDRGG
ncbi:hypothetical protein B0I74DRAFT_147530 [Yarrowia lipolytica]|uniref:Uncharacterized protein n=1 Tax=Yarrowia lipolytica TaxID=4952 RepID=A0A371C7P6_YARLL|nr:hypothetical protein B0I71DRAFT_152677 [Yarrowia lipolytica]RDW44795.1 hypothetical protein B0I74DRAFT_147530 [Yarrowia lipolytica]